MMTNSAVAQKNGFASVIGTGKPASAMEGMGLDFMALLEQAEAMPADGAAVTGEQLIASASVSVGANVSANAGAATALALPGVPTPEGQEGSADAGDAETVPLDADQPKTSPAADARAGIQPSMTMAKPSTDHPPEKAAKDDADESDEPSTEDKKIKPALTEGLALPLLQKIGDMAARDAGSASEANGKAIAPAADPQVAALKSFALPSSALRQAAELPAQAAEPAQQRASERLQAVPRDMAMPASAPEKTAATAATHRKIEAPLAQAPIPGASVAEAADNGAAPAHHGTESAQSDEPTGVQSAKAAPASTFAMPVAQATDLAATSVADAIALDTGAMLGEQVIDMGVDGQWIDRMAQEIVDISAGTGRASFTLNPDNLGRLQVEILQRDEGADVRLIADTDDAVNALNQGRQQLQQDARMQAVRINEVQIERGDSNHESIPATRHAASGQDLAQQQGQSQSQAFHKKPTIEAVTGMARGEEPGEGGDHAAPSRNARYA